jgi:DNA-binding transcriptional regulator YdaS (Cro superfamily)
MASEIFERLLKEVTPEESQFVEKNVAIGRQVRHILAVHPTINSQKALADALGKEPSEISKWLSGLHNIGLENITKMEVALGRDIILTDEQARERYEKPATGYQVFQVSRYKGKVDSQVNYPGWSGKRNITYTPIDEKTSGSSH